MNGLTELAITGPLLIAALVAAAAGAVSFASPCCIPLVPGYLAYLAGLAGTTSSTNPCPTPAVISGGGPANDSAPSTASPTVRVRRTERARLIVAALLFVAGFTAVFTAGIMSVLGLSDLLVLNEQLLERLGGVVTTAWGWRFSG